jgi:hypothetical protein
MSTLDDGSLDADVALGEWERCKPVPAMGVSVHQFALSVGVVEATIAKRIADGRMSALEDGSLDPDIAQAEWASCRPTKPTRGKHRPDNDDRTHSEDARFPGTSRPTAPHEVKDAA